MKKNVMRLAGLLLLAGLGARECGAWDYEGHRIVNQLALASLPKDFPEFVQTPEARERVAYLAGEPDRWRNVGDLNHENGPEHYIDLEQLDDYGIDMKTLTHFRYDFVAQLALARAAHPERFAPIDANADRDHTRQLIGFLPWAIVENFDKLKSGFSCLKAFKEHGGTPDEIANAQQNIIYIMGVMGHYVGDGAQPLHATKHHHGWVGENPNHYSTDSRIHAWIDGGYFRKIGGTKAADLQANIHPAELVSTDGAGSPFDRVMTYLAAQQKLVEPLYKMEKEGKLSGEGDVGHEGRAFLEKQLVAGGQMLGNIWYTAWQQAKPDTFLQSQLERRKLAPEK